MPIVEDLQKNTPGARIHLYTIDFTTSIRYTSGSPSVVNIINSPTNVTFNSVVYTGITSFKFVPAAYKLNDIPEPTFTTDGQYDVLTDAFNAFDSIIGTKITRTFTLEQYLDGEAQADPSQKFDEIWYVEQLITRNKNELKLKLSPTLGLKQKLTTRVLPPQSIRTFNK